MNAGLYLPIPVNIHDGDLHLPTWQAGGGGGGGGGRRVGRKEGGEWGCERTCVGNQVAYAKSHRPSSDEGTTTDTILED